MYVFLERLCGGFSRRVSSVSSISACMAAVASTMQSMESLMNLLAVVAILMRPPSNMLILMRDFEYVIPKRPFMRRSGLSSPLEASLAALAMHSKIDISLIRSLWPLLSNFTIISFGMFLSPMPNMGSR